MVNLYIDTNVLLNFYHFSKSNLDELEKLMPIIAEGSACLYISEQGRNEFCRNRDSKVKAAIQDIEQLKLNPSFPEICKEYEHFNQLKEIKTQYEAARKALLTQLHEDAFSNTLRADKLVKSLFENGKETPLSADIIDKAKLRMDLGNPPGKSGSLGDAIIWEGLLRDVPQGEDLYFVSQDQDYSSQLNKSEISSFLKDEWSSVKNSSIFLCPTLTTLFNKVDLEIHLTNEDIERMEPLILGLEDSGNFATTHNYISFLSAYEAFTKDQVSRLLNAFVANDQINWIATDQDVSEFFHKMLEQGKIHSLPEEILDQTAALLNPPPF